MLLTPPAPSNLVSHTFMTTIPTTTTMTAITMTQLSADVALVKVLLVELMRKQFEYTSQRERAVGGGLNGGPTDERGEGEGAGVYYVLDDPDNHPTVERVRRVAEALRKHVVKLAAAFARLRVDKQARGDTKQERLDNLLPEHQRKMEALSGTSAGGWVVGWLGAVGAVCGVRNPTGLSLALIRNTRPHLLPPPPAHLTGRLPKYVFPKAALVASTPTTATLPALLESALRETIGTGTATTIATNATTLATTLATTTTTTTTNTNIAALPLYRVDAKAWSAAVRVQPELADQWLLDDRLNIALVRHAVQMIRSISGSIRTSTSNRGSRKNSSNDNVNNDQQDAVLITHPKCGRWLAGVMWCGVVRDARGILLHAVVRPSLTPTLAVTSSYDPLYVSPNPRHPYIHLLDSIHGAASSVLIARPPRAHRGGPRGADQALEAGARRLAHAKYVLLFGGSSSSTFSSSSRSSSSSSLSLATHLRTPPSLPHLLTPSATATATTTAPQSDVTLLEDDFLSVDGRQAPFDKVNYFRPRMVPAFQLTPLHTGTQQ